MKNNLFLFLLIFLFPGIGLMGQFECVTESKSDGVYPAIALLIPEVEESVFEQAIQTLSDELSGEFQNQKRLQEYRIESARIPQSPSDYIELTLKRYALEDSLKVIIWIKENDHYVACNNDEQTRDYCSEIADRFRKNVEEVKLNRLLASLIKQIDEAAEEKKATQKRIKDLSSAINKLEVKLSEMENQLQKEKDFMPQIQKQLQHLSKMKANIELQITELQ